MHHQDTAIKVVHYLSMASEAIAHELDEGRIENIAHASFCLKWASHHIVQVSGASIARKSTLEQNRIARAALDWLIQLVKAPSNALSQSTMPVPDLHQLDVLRIGTMGS